MRTAVSTLFAAAALVLSGCSGTDAGRPNFAESFGVEAALAEIPLPEVPIEVEGVRIVTMTATDLAGAAASADVQRPILDPDLGPPEFDEVYREYSGILFDEPRDGPSSPVVIPPVELVFEGLRLQSEEDFRSELGWSALDIDAIVEVDIFPTTRFDVMTLRRDLAELTARAADDGVVDVGPGENGERRVADRTNLRLLGRPLRVAPDPDRQMVAVARDRPSVLAWLDGEGVDGTWADVPEMAAVAERLDRRDVYSAIVSYGDFRAPRFDDAELLSEMMERFGVADLDELLELYPITEPFAARGAGWSGVDEDLRVIFVYAFADESAAQRSREPIETVYRSTEPIPAGFLPLSELLAVEEVVAAGRTVEVVLDPEPAVASGPLVRGLLEGNPIQLLHR